MTRFSVWAPRAERVELVLEEARVPMAPAGGGWWQVAHAQAGPGTDYRFSLDGGEPLPDPRSPWQPEGPHGPSRVVDHDAFAWQDSAWRGFHLPSAVLYELHVGTFTPEGTFEAAIARLDALVELGITAVELLPVAEFPGVRGWGYDGVDLFAPHHAYGGPEGLKRLVDACHARGLGVVLDVVYNHLGPDGNYLAAFGPYFTDHYRTPWGDAVNLDDAGADEVRRFFVDNALSWMRDYHVDALRLDAVHAFFDRSAVHFLEELQEAVRVLADHLGRPLHLIAESDLNDPRIVRPVDAGGYGLAAMWSDDFHHALHALLTGEETGYYAGFGGVAQVAHALRHGFVYDHRYSEHRARRHGRPFRAMPGTRLLGYVQNHDQVGNRARGERLGHLAGPARQKIGAALVLTAPFVPMLFQGEEWGASAPFPYFVDHTDPGLAEAVRRGRREEFAAFGWQPEDIPDPQAPDTFASARLDWDERGRPEHAELLDWYRRLIALRRSEPALTDGRLDDVDTLADGNPGWLRVTRGPIVVAVNLGGGAGEVPLEGRAQVLISTGEPEENRVLEGEVVLPPDAVAVLRRLD